MDDKRIIVVYKSKTGFTEKYARWIADDLHCDIVCLEKFNIAEMVRYDVIIFGGGIHAGRVNGIKYIKNNMPFLAEKTVIVFATGATAPIPEEIERFRKDNIPDSMNIAFFYFQSGMNYARIHGTDRLLMGALKTVLTVKGNKSDVEKGTLDAIQKSYDYSSQSQIEPLTKYIKQSIS
jgi:menaquinone-dependent protoporphyrinogen IX oxidase